MCAALVARNISAERGGAAALDREALWLKNTTLNGFSFCVNFSKDTASSP
jgi:hypothetical protein